ncbi:MAG: hypothetical protein D6812_09885 [Deltaproteobacteria bacterium]|nr:MAG: hypothetical protein D6812_09885 [Deltaproteobacteria bacterium]
MSYLNVNITLDIFVFLPGKYGEYTKTREQLQKLLQTPGSQAALGQVVVAKHGDAVGPDHWGRIFSLSEYFGEDIHNGLDGEFRKKLSRWVRDGRGDFPNPRAHKAKKVQAWNARLDLYTDLTQKEMERVRSITDLGNDWLRTQEWAAAYWKTVARLQERCRERLEFFQKRLLEESRRWPGSIWEESARLNLEAWQRMEAYLASLPDITEPMGLPIPLGDGCLGVMRDLLSARQNIRMEMFFKGFFDRKKVRKLYWADVGKWRHLLR